MSPSQVGYHGYALQPPHYQVGVLASIGTELASTVRGPPTTDCQIHQKRLGEMIFVFKIFWGLLTKTLN